MWDVDAADVVFDGQYVRLSDERAAREQNRYLTLRDFANLCVKNIAGGDAFGAVDIATIMKLSRVLMLVFAAIIIAIWWEKKHSEVQSTGKKTVAFPWFMLGFIGASIIGTFVPFVTSITPQLVDFAYIVLGMAMAALGINVNFKAIASKGKKPMLASFLTSILLMCFAAGVAMLFF